MNLKKPFYILILLSIFSIVSCLTENAEDKFIANGQFEQKKFFDDHVLTILESKCNSCHDYHNSPSSEYRSFEKTSGNINNILKRVNDANPINIMPPTDASPLSISEVQSLVEFKNLLDEGFTDLRVTLNWTAFKFPGFNTRAAVYGSFNEISWIASPGTTIYDKLKNSELNIFTNSVNVGGSTVKSETLRDHFFRHLQPVIHCSIHTLDQEIAVAKVIINGIEQQLILNISMEDNTLRLHGVLEDLGYFDTDIAFDNLELVCGDLHQNTVWPDVEVELIIENYDKL